MTPTGVAIRDVREQLFDAAERILLREGPSALTSRAVTAEAGCAKGVLHRHFADFDAFLVELVEARVVWMEARGAALMDAAGVGSVVGNLAGVLGDVFGSIGLGIVSLVISRDELRRRLRRNRGSGVPVLTEAGAVIAGYLEAERELGRVEFFVDVRMLALTLVGGGHLLYAGREGVGVEVGDVEEFVGSVVGHAV
ncbi:MAG TPA: TetR/AcrR family transcriptional regulator [Actinocrinis sp.]|nr:TetR/AcrR family transcriptional regulator [Actinocrinis sp.]